MEGARLANGTVEMLRTAEVTMERKVLGWPMEQWRC